MQKKAITYLILIFCTLCSFAQTEENAPNGPRGIKNKRDELRRRQEMWRTYNIYGDLISEYEYKNDKKEGKGLIYFPEGGDKGGKVREEIQYFDGKKDGQYTRKYISGQIAIEGAYDLGRRVGLWTSFYEDGQTKSEGNYSNEGKKEGEWKYYNRKGVLVRTINHSLIIPAPVKKTDEKKTIIKPGIKK